MPASRPTALGRPFAWPEQHFSPPEDERVSVTAKLDVPRRPAAPQRGWNTAGRRSAAVAAAALEGEEALPTGGSMTLVSAVLGESGSAQAS